MTRWVAVHVEDIVVLGYGHDEAREIAESLGEELRWLLADRQLYGRLTSRERPTERDVAGRSITDSGNPKGWVRVGAGDRDRPPHSAARLAAHAIVEELAR